MSDKNFNLNDELKMKVMSADCCSQNNAEKIITLCNAAKKLVNDPTVTSLLDMIYELSDESMNEVNAVAEALGANYRAA